MDTQPFTAARTRDRVIFFVLGIVATLIVQFFVPSAHAQDVTATSTSGSNSNSISGSVSSATQNLGATQGNAQNITFNSPPQRERTRLDTNSAIPLTAAVSFSSDYCGGVSSGGASAAGVSLGFSKPVVDGNCQSMRRAEKFGVMAVTASNMGDKTTASRLLSLAIWELCTAEANARPRGRYGADGVPSTESACLKMALVAGDALPPVVSNPQPVARADDRALVPPPATPNDDAAKKLKAKDEQEKANAKSPPVAMVWHPHT